MTNITVKQLRQTLGLFNLYTKLRDSKLDDLQDYNVEVETPAHVIHFVLSDFLLPVDYSNIDSLTVYNVELFEESQTILIYAM